MGVGGCVLAFWEGPLLQEAGLWSAHHRVPQLPAERLSD